MVPLLSIQKESSSKSQSTIWLSGGMIFFFNDRSVDETLRLLEGYQFVQEHGQVCPANWKKGLILLLSLGSKTMIPNVKDSKTYFKSEN